MPLTEAYTPELTRWPHVSPTGSVMLRRSSKLLSLLPPAPPEAARAPARAHAGEQHGGALMQVTAPRTTARAPDARSSSALATTTARRPNITEITCPGSPVCLYCPQ
jgi:hypothetical protein